MRRAKIAPGNASTDGAQLQHLRIPRRYALALAATVGALALRAALQPVLGQSAPLIVLLLAPTIAAYCCGFGPGVLATVLCGFAGVTLFMPPLGEPLPATPREWARLAAFVGIGIAISWALHERLAALRALRLDREAGQRNEAALAEGARRFRAIFEAVQAVGVMLDAQGRVTFANDFLLRLTGWRDDEVIGHPWFDRFVPPPAPGERGTLEALFREHVVRGEIFAHHENEIVTRSGERRLIAWDNTVLRAADGTLDGVASIGRDVTAERAADARLRSSEAHLLALYRQSGAAFAETDMDGRFVAANDSYCELVGRTRDALLCLRFTDVTHPADLDENRTHFERLLATGAAFSMEKRYVRPDGRSVWVTNDVTRIDLPDAPPRILAVSIDITARKSAEARLRAGEARLRAVFERARVGMARVSFANTTFLEVNDELCRMLGYTRSELTTRPWIAFTHPDDVDLDLMAVHRMGGGRIDEYTAEKRFLHRDGHEVLARMNLSLVRDAQGEADYEIAVIEDVTERSHQRQALLEADRRKDEFLAMLAHELRNPLAPLRNALSVLDRSEDPAACARARAMMSRQLAQLVRLVDDLLEVSRITTGKLKLTSSRVAVQHVVDAAIETSRPSIEHKRHTLVVEPASVPVWVTGDPVRLAQVLTNLLNNAAKYSEPGATVTVRVTVPRPERVCIAVTDTGIGIPRHALAHVFELFSQIEHAEDRTQGGLGIGLSLARRLVELHGGTLHAASDGPGRGSTFTVELPTSIRADGVGDAPAPAHASPAARCRIVVADDNRDAADSLALMLRMNGHEVHTGYDGDEALAAVRTHRPDVAILDIGMPRHDGFEVARTLRADPDQSGLVLLALTGWGQENDKRRTADAGFDRHFTKPVDPADVEAVLRTVCRSSAAVAGR